MVGRGNVKIVWSCSEDRGIKGNKEILNIETIEYSGTLNKMPVQTKRFQK